eukprot:scaffold29203_cov67-Phaeocystis_antarctica.AAC.5
MLGPSACGRVLQGSPITSASNALLRPLSGAAVLLEPAAPFLKSGSALVRARVYGSSGSPWVSANDEANASSSV